MTQATISTAATESATSPIPAWEPMGQWLTPAEYAKITGRSLRTIQHWCRTGVLRDFNIPHFQDTSRRRRWWIKLIP